MIQIHTQAQYEDMTIDNFKVRYIINQVVRNSGVTYNQLTDKTRKREVVIQRQTAMYLIKLNNKNMSLKTIGEYFGNRDHTTVIHAINTIEDLYETNKEFKNELIEISNSINPTVTSKIGTLSTYRKVDKF